MPFALAILAIVFISTAIRGTTSQLLGLLKSEFTGSGNYLYWVISILIIGSLGYVKKLQPVSDMFLALVLIVMFIGNKGAFFPQFMNAIGSSRSGCNTSNSTGGLTTSQALDAAKSAPGAGFGLTLPPLNPGQIVPSPFAMGPM